jgi:hypothetical protein
MMRKALVVAVLSAILAMAASESLAAPANARMITPPKFGVVREVTGAKLLVVKPNKACAPSDPAAPDGQCFAGVRPGTGQTQRVLVIDNARPGDRIGGQINRDYQIYEISQNGAGAQAVRRVHQTSDIMVPRDCFALKDEPVKYTISSVNGETRAEESQFIACGGGPEQARGPYLPQGAAMASDPRGWRRTEDTYITGAPRYLAVPDASCPQEFRVRDGHCAKSAITYLNANASVAEVDLVAAKGAIKGDEVLAREDLSQWVLKRRSNGFKADSRWLDKSMFSLAEGCTAIEGLKWHVSSAADGFMITEKTLSRCGAPIAPAPTALYEVLGADYFILNCSWSDGQAEVDQRCRSQANDFLNRAGKSSGEFVIVSDNLRDNDRLHAGSYVRFTFVRAEMTPMDVTIKRVSTLPSIAAAGCSSAARGGAGDGFMAVRQAGVLWARRYQNMNCAVY